MDIALLKIDADETLPTFGNSDTAKVGEWVLQWKPYNNINSNSWYCLCKARDLGSNGIQSFIQTDAAVNPGNSGGA
jgi:S1-C subfamily serine protease